MPVCHSGTGPASDLRRRVHSPARRLLSRLYRAEHGVQWRGGAVIGTATNPTHRLPIRTTSRTSGGVHLLRAAPTFVNSFTPVSRRELDRRRGRGGGHLRCVADIPRLACQCQRRIRAAVSSFRGNTTFRRQPRAGRVPETPRSPTARSRRLTVRQRVGGSTRRTTPRTLTRARILRNVAGTGGGLNSYRARYDVVDSVIDSNRTNLAAGFGGGIAAQSNYAASDGVAPSYIALTRTLVRNNTALMPSGVGGGIVVGGDGFNASVRATLTVIDSVVDGNRSTIQGGGIHANVTDLTVINSIIIRNTTGDIGGGILVLGTNRDIGQSTIARDNTAGQFGGASISAGRRSI